jgi:hypothetical protein
VSWIGFNFPDETEVRVSGSERASFDIMIENHAKAALGLVYGPGSSYLLESLRPVINPKGSLGVFISERADPRGEQVAQALGWILTTMSFRTGPAPFAWEGQEINTRQLLLNTVLATGSDPMRMAVKIHFQCEIHGYIMGFHRKWLADIVQEGLEEGIYRRGHQWEELVAKLREANEGPVVTSSSSADPFPNVAVTSWMPPLPEGVSYSELSEEQRKERAARQEEWNCLGFDKQWKLAVKGLKVPGRNRPWAPDTLRAYRFGHELSLLDLIRQDTERIEKGLKSA